MIPELDIRIAPEQRAKQVVRHIVVLSEYPPAEYVLLWMTSFLGDFRIYAIKLVQCLKVAAVFWLAARLAVVAGVGELVPVALIAPSAVAFYGVYSTDINAIIGFLAILLIVLGGKRTPGDRGGPGLWLLVALGALSKYTFWLFLPPFYIVLWRSRGLGWFSSIPPLLIAVHLAVNFHAYGNPVFPVGSSLDPALSAEVARFLTAWSKPNVYWLSFIGCGFLAGGGLLAILPGHSRLWYGMVGLYFAGWVVVMQPETGGDTGRYLLPVSIAAGCLINPRSISLRVLLLYAVLAAVALPAFIHLRFTTPVYYLLLATFGAALILAYAPAPFRHLSCALALLTCVFYSAARVYLKFDVSRDLGYAEYSRHIAEVEDGARTGIVITDFARLPHSVRLQPNVLVFGSAAYSPAAWSLARTGTFDCGGKHLKLFGSVRFLALTQHFTFDHCPSIIRVQVY